MSSLKTLCLVSLNKCQKKFIKSYVNGIWAILIGWLFVCEKQGWHDTLGTVQQDWAQHWGHEVATDSVDSPSTHKSRIFMDRIWGWCTWFVGRWCFELGCIDTELYSTGTKHFIYISLQQLYTINNLLSSNWNYRAVWLKYICD